MFQKVLNWCQTCLDSDLKAKTKGVYITPYSPTKENILVVGPISGDKYEDIVFPLLSPDPAKDKNVFFEQASNLCRCK